MMMKQFVVRSSDGKEEIILKGGWEVGSCMQLGARWPMGG